MALLKCPECSNEVSDKATSCPKCGFPLQSLTAPPAGDIDSLIIQTLSREGKIAAIKLYRDYDPSAGLAEAKRYVESIEAGRPTTKVSSSARQGCSPVVALGGILILGCAILAIWGALHMSSSGERSNTPPPSVASSEASHTQTVKDRTPKARLSADELYSAYKENEVSADTSYKGKIVIISGIIRDIGKDILDSPYVIVGGEGFL